MENIFISRMDLSSWADNGQVLDLSKATDLPVLQGRTDQRQLSLRLHIFFLQLCIILQVTELCCSETSNEVGYLVEIRPMEANVAQACNT